MNDLVHLGVGGPYNKCYPRGRPESHALPLPKHTRPGLESLRETHSRHTRYCFVGSWSPVLLTGHSHSHLLLLCVGVTVIVHTGVSSENKQKTDKRRPRKYLVGVGAAETWTADATAVVVFIVTRVLQTKSQTAKRERAFNVMISDKRPNAVIYFHVSKLDGCVDDGSKASLSNKNAF